MRICGSCKGSDKRDQETGLSSPVEHPNHVGRKLLSGMIRWKQDDAGFQDWGLEFGNPDFVAYAESYGAKGHRVGKADELLPLLRSCLDEGGVHLIDVPIDYAENASLGRR